MKSFVAVALFAAYSILVAAEDDQCFWTCPDSVGSAKNLHGYPEGDQLVCYYSSSNSHPFICSYSMMTGALEGTNVAQCQAQKAATGHGCTNKGNFKRANTTSGSCQYTCARGLKDGSHCVGDYATGDEDVMCYYQSASGDVTHCEYDTVTGALVSSTGDGCMSKGYGVNCPRPIYKKGTHRHKKPSTSDSAPPVQDPTATPDTDEAP